MNTKDSTAASRPDNLAIIERIIEAHKAIRVQMGAVGNAVNDRQSLGMLRDIGSGWVPARMDMLREKSDNLRRALGTLTGGLETHFGYEESYLPPLLGEYLMRSLLIEHDRIKQQLSGVDRQIAETTLEGLSRDDILLTELKIQQMVSQLTQVIEEHALREEVVLGMLKLSFE